MTTRQRALLVATFASHTGLATGITCRLLGLPLLACLLGFAVNLVLSAWAAERWTRD